MTLEEAISKVGALTEQVGKQNSELDTLRKVKKDLEEDLGKVRVKNTDLDKQLVEIKEKLPTADSVVLSKADHDKLVAKASNEDVLTSKVKSLENRDVVRDNAGKYNSSALIAHTPLDGTWEVVTTKVEGKDVKSLRLVQAIDGKEVKTPLDDFVTKVSQEKFVDFNTEPKKTVLEQLGKERVSTPEGTGKAYAETMPNPF